MALINGSTGRQDVSPPEAYSRSSLPYSPPKVQETVYSGQSVDPLPACAGVHFSNKAFDFGRIWSNWSAAVCPDKVTQKLRSAKMKGKPKAIFIYVQPNAHSIRQKVVRS
jgi:hypothetical protein